MAETAPLYLTGEDSETIRARMLAAVPKDFDTSEGSFYWDTISPAAIEMAQAQILAQVIYKLGFASTAASTTPGDVTQELDWRTEEHGVIRKPAVQATGFVTFTGTTGSAIPIGTKVSTASTDSEPAQVFATTQSAMIGVDGTATVAIQAVTAGRLGNVAAQAIVFLVDPIAGVQTVINNDPTGGGVDIEDDISLLARFLQTVRNPSSSGNKADYVKWAQEVPGVGGACCVAQDGGNGRVGVYIIDTNKTPASKALVDDVQDYIAPHHTATLEEDKFVYSGYGVSTDTTLGDDTLNSAKFVYNASGNGVLTITNIGQYLPQAGIWSLRPHMKVNSASGATNLVTVQVYNNTAGAIAKTAPSGGVDATVTKKANELLTSFHPGGETDPDASNAGSVDFYWDGQANLDIKITRLTTDTTTILYLDHAQLISTFSKDTGESKAPIGARVTCKAAVAVPINVTATLTYVSGYDPTSVKAQVTANVTAFLKALAFATDNDVRYVRIGQTILDTPGVQDYASLTVNGGTANIAIADYQVATVGTVTLT